MVSNWDTEAATMADYAVDNAFKATVRRMPWKQEGVSVVFGHDGYDRDRRAKDEVAMVREYLALEGIPVLGFGVDSHTGYSWAMLVKTGDVGMLNKLVWACWVPREPVRDVMARDGDVRGVQADIASAAIQESSPAPRAELN